MVSPTAGTASVRFLPAPGAYYNDHPDAIIEDFDRR
jgi:hypothetical protein